MYARRLEGRTLTLGVSGKLWRDALVMYDRETDSLWTQISGEALQGPLAGKSLVEFPSELTTWKDWRERYPDTWVLKKDQEYAGSAYDWYTGDDGKLGVFGTRNPDKRLDGKQVVYGVRLPDGGAVAVVASRVEVEGGSGVAVRASSRSILLAPAASGPIRAFLLPSSPPGGPDPPARRRDDGTWELADGSVVDPDQEAIVSGPQAGADLTRLSVLRAYWFIWASFYPRSEIVR